MLFVVSLFKGAPGVPLGVLLGVSLKVSPKVSSTVWGAYHAQTFANNKGTQKADQNHQRKTNGNESNENKTNKQNK